MHPYSETPILHTDSQAWEGMRRAGACAASVLDWITPYVAEGISTQELDRLCHEKIQAMGAIPACLGYRGYPKTICTSLNDVVCHGIPQSDFLKRGDILNIDVTVIVDGWHGDTSRMFCIGEPFPQAKRLVQAAFEAMWAGIHVIKPGATLGDVGYAIQHVAKAHGFSVVRDYCGHGIGRVFHAPPQVLNYGTPGSGLVLQPGMFLTVEPMLNVGQGLTRVLSDGWTVVTKDKSLSAQWEHTLGVTETGYEIFTSSMSKD